MLGNLAKHENFMDRVLASELCVQLVTILRDKDISVVENAIYALSHIASNPEGANAIIDANALIFLWELLTSQKDKLQSQTSIMLENLARHQNFTDAVHLSRHFLNVNTHLSGAGIELASTIISARELLESPNSDLRIWISFLLGELVGDEFADAVLASEEPCLQLIMLLRALACSCVI
ncbi:hypothetical protein C8R43DRAFT_1123623 [Mycena crocata]|nr:hypothetical protein C8R43DRAFT_1123623 [Mycena crocata]